VAHQRDQEQNQKQIEENLGNAAAANDMPVNASNAAINATIKNPSAQRNMPNLRFFSVGWKCPIAESG